MKRILSIVILFAWLFTSCDNEENFDSQATRVALNLSAEISNAKTRADDISKFYSGAEIGVTGRYSDKSGETITESNIRYSYNSEGKWCSDNPFYYQNTNTATFTAYYPYDKNIDTYGVLNNVEAKDYLFAPAADGSVSANDVKLTFSHCMSKIVVTFKKDIYVTDADISNLSSFFIGNLYKIGSFDTTSGKAEPVKDGSYVKDLIEVYASSADDQSIGSAVVFPQEITDDVYLIVKFGTINYKAKLISKGTTLSPGSVYNYSITVNKTGLEVTYGSNIESWSWGSISLIGPDGNYGLGAYDYGEITNENITKVKQYALAFTDGTYTNLLSDDEIVMANNSAITAEDRETIENVISAKIDSLSAVQKSAICGIVFWTAYCEDESEDSDSDENSESDTKAERDENKVDIDDPILAIEHPSCTHGLIVSLSNARSEIYSSNSSYDSYAIYWCRNEKWTEDLSGFMNDESLFDSPYKGSYADIRVAADDANINRILGYNNTRILRAYNSYYNAIDPNSDSYGGSNKKITAISVLDNEFEDRNRYPAFSSGWYLPSIKELTLLYSGDITYNGSNYAGSGVVKSNVDIILSKLGKANTNEIYYTWSSSEKSADEMWTMYIEKSAGYIEGGGKIYCDYLRPVCAF